MSFFTLLTAGLAAFAPLVSAYTQPQGDGPSGNAFSAPGSGTSVQAGQDFTVKWDPSTVGSVTLLLLKGQNGQSLSVLYPIAEQIDNTGTYTWKVASDLTSGPTSTTGYGIQLINDADGKYQYTTPFGVTPVSGGASNSTSDSTPTPRVGPPVAATRAASSSAASASGDASPQTYGADSSASPVVVASVYADATSTGIVLVTPTTAAAAATTTLATSASVRVSTTASRGPSGTSSITAATSTGGASSVKTGFMGLAAAAGLAILAL